MQIFIINNARFCYQKSKMYYSQIEEWKYKIKKIKIENLINNDLEPSSSHDETENDTDNETEFDSDE